MIRGFADTNWLTALYFDQGERTRVLRSWSRKQSPPLCIGAPVLLETRNVFTRLAGARNPPQWQALNEDLGNRLRLALHSWAELVTQSEELTDRFAHKAGVSAGDILVVASASLSGAGFFLSFDEQSGCRALASILKLSVFPELTMADKQIVAKLKA